MKSFFNASFCILILMMFLFGENVISAQNKYADSRNFIEAESCLDESDYQGAYEALSKEIAIHPDNAYAHLYLSQIYSLYEDYFDSIESATSALNYLGSSETEFIATAYNIRANAYEELGQMDLAVKDYTSAIDRSPKNVEYIIDRAQFYYFLDLFDESDQDYKAALSLEPNNPLALMGMGSNKIGRDDYSGAITYFNKVAASYPEYAGVYVYRGLAYEGLNNDDKAIADYIRSISLGSDSITPVVYLARVSSNSYSKVEARIKEKMSSYPNNEVWPFTMGFVCQVNNNYSSAITNYKKAFAINALPLISSRLYECYAHLSDWDNAMYYIDKSIELDPEELDYMVDKAFLYLYSGKEASSVRQMDKVVDKSPMNSTYYTYRGFFKTFLNDQDGALEDYTKALEVNHYATDALIKRGVIYLKKGYKDAANKDFQKCIDIEKEYSIIDNTPYAYFYLGKKDQATKAVSEMLKSDHSSDSYYQAACVTSLMNERTDAIKYLTKAIEEGYDDYNYISIDPDLENIRGEKAYEALMSKAGKVANTNSASSSSGASTSNSAASSTKSSTSTSSSKTSSAGSKTSSSNTSSSSYRPSSSSSSNNYYSSQGYSLYSEPIVIPYTDAYGLMKIKGELNGLPVSMTYENTQNGIQISSLQASSLLSSKHISLSDISYSGEITAKSIPVGAVINLRTLYIGELLLTNVKATVVENNKAAFSVGKKAFKYFDVYVGKTTIKLVPKD